MHVMPSGQVSPLLQRNRQTWVSATSQNGAAVPVAADGHSSSLAHSGVQSPMTMLLNVPLMQVSVGRHAPGPSFTQSP